MLVLFAHLEGNIGDEIETTPLLKMLKRWGCHTSVLMSGWLGGARLGIGSVREHNLIDKIYPYEDRNTLQHDDFDVIILAPGPWGICYETSRWKHRIDVFFGGSFIGNLTKCDMQQHLEMASTSLVVIREPYSLDKFKDRLLSWKGQIMLSCDLSHSYQVAASSFEYLQQYYQQQLSRVGDMILVFTRPSNSKIMELTTQNNTKALQLITLQNDIVSLDPSNVIFCNKFCD